MGMLDSYHARRFLTMSHAGIGLADSSVERGAAAASIVCSRRGAQPPTSAEVDDLIAEKA
jgi:sugar/nucleoside kinase (ribokinase family)